MKRSLSFFLAVVLAVSLCACSQKAGASWQEQYDLGVRYLSEGNYEEAILAFTAAIEIDPKQPVLYLGRADAYLGAGESAENLTAALADYETAVDLDETNVDAWLGMADVYIRRGEYDKALEVLTEALEKTGGDAAIADKLTELELSTATFGQRIGKLFESGYQGGGISMDDITFMGQSIVGLTFQTAEGILRGQGFKVQNQNDLGFDLGYNWFDAVAPWGSITQPYINVVQMYDSDSVDSVSYFHRNDTAERDPLPVGICGIYTQDTIETVLTKLGFDNASEIVAALYELAEITFQSNDALREELEGAEYTYRGETMLRIRLSVGGTYVDYASGEEVRWTGAPDANCDMGFTVNLLMEEKLNNLQFSFEDGRLEAVKLV